MISRPLGSVTALAASIDRRTSSRVISRFLPATATTPRLLTPFMCAPDSPRCTASISMPAVSSASSSAFLIDSTAASRLTTTPRRMPRESAQPDPDDVERPVVARLADDGGHLRRADVEPDDVALLTAHHAPSPSRRARAPSAPAVTVEPSSPPRSRAGPHEHARVVAQVDVVDRRDPRLAASARGRDRRAAARRTARARGARGPGRRRASPPRPRRRRRPPATAARRDRGAAPTL